MFQVNDLKFEDSEFLSTCIFYWRIVAEVCSIWSTPYSSITSSSFHHATEFWEGFEYCAKPSRKNRRLALVQQTDPNRSWEIYMCYQLHRKVSSLMALIGVNSIPIQLPVNLEIIFMVHAYSIGWMTKLFSMHLYIELLKGGWKYLLLLNLYLLEILLIDLVEFHLGLKSA